MPTTKYGLFPLAINVVNMSANKVYTLLISALCYGATCEELALCNWEKSEMDLMKYLMETYRIQN